MQLIQTIAGFMLAARNIPIASALQTPAEFHLVSSSSDTALDNLYLSTKSTGPLNSNPVFRDPANAASFYLTNTTLNYDAPNKAPWALALLRGNAAQGNMEVSVNPSVTVAISTGFHINGDMHLYSESPSWGGWLVCPGQQTSLLQLFYHNTSVGPDVPTGCGRVQLTAVYTSA